ncbi:M90 family metallopeptidase [Mucilaginibacter aquatilis]|uniref:Peptidase n=1 Tax=Mucilaginibacter aquatilis TaxID=1517760 RepID=A0A6I4IBN9_9SPHI|nr:M90 family metallopeptidase [Mucilaginibacter aquatilis]MVN92635.1 peptidase [Mucilaginibacter aquatilis]
MNTFILIAVAIVFSLCILGYFLFLRKPKAAAAADKSITASLKQLLLDNVSFYEALNSADKLRFEHKITAFLEEVHIEGVGLEVDDLDRVLVASSAVIPVFGFDEWRYNNLTNVILYPDTFNNDFQFEGDENRNIMGMVGSGYMNGQMLLSRAALIRGFSKSSGKHNTGIHEFVHLLDKSDGATDGVPENFLPHEYATPWLKMMHQEIDRIERGKSDIDAYAATNEAEFLAVVSEYFFEKPDQLKDKHPELYAQLSRMFAQNPAAE